MLAVALTVGLSVITVPRLVIALAALAVHLDARKRRKTKASSPEKTLEEVPHDHQPCYQRKGELAATNSQRCELPVDETIEMYAEDARDNAKEIATTRDHDDIATLLRQELEEQREAIELECESQEWHEISAQQPQEPL